LARRAAGGPSRGGVGARRRLATQRAMRGGVPGLAVSRSAPGASCGVDAGADGVAAAVWRLPDQHSGAGLFEVPAGSLLGAMAGAAGGREPAFAGAAPLIMRPRVIVIARLRGAGADRVAAGLLPDLHDVVQ